MPLCRERFTTDSHSEWMTHTISQCDEDHANKTAQKHAFTSVDKGR